MEPSILGTALSLFQIAYLQQLRLAAQQISLENSEDLKEDTIKTYNKAIKEFKRIDHLLGVYLCKKQLATLCDIAPQIVEKYRQRFKQSEACYKRKHADENESLLLELAINNKNDQLMNDPAFLVNDDMLLHSQKSIPLQANRRLRANSEI